MSTLTILLIIVVLFSPRRWWFLLDEAGPLGTHKDNCG
jgi:hypothetical protein